MIAPKYLVEISNKWQTSQFNTTREYLQNRFLTILYQKDGSGDLYFKGGTALRIIFGSPRFSEDLDFSMSKTTFRDLENLIESVLVELERENLEVEILDAKETTGGYIFDSKTRFLDFDIGIKLNLVRKKNTVGDVILVNSELTPSYPVQILKQEKLLGEKLTALISRKKTRDFFDLYFILRTQNLRSLIKISSEERTKLKQLIRNLDDSQIAELKPLLPRSFHPLLKNFPELLIKELG